ncbi:HD domain-containing protein [Ructibacterium gallinarum]|uniref:HD domain-containing protein n=1 Tax=Ructibacterium gallinarum TaxID=2779355 RepID=A0A9D5R8W3_9FIRM|nr:HD domain-containing protein [Ructibacterium gallinarum]MBE5040392.1 HD domain-containing protein [Ructibacterium gallinarum]
MPNKEKGNTERGAGVTFYDIVKNEEIKTYLEKGDKYIGTMGYTDHSLLHAQRAAKVAYSILTALNYDKRTAELARIAGYIHDIGNVVNRIDHAQSSAVIAFHILTRLGMEPREIAKVIAAIGNHDEGTGTPVNHIAAALILADKTDVRRSRVRNREMSSFDIHDRVNYAVTQSDVSVLHDKTIRLELKIDTEICSLMDYFEIFLTRMVMCKRAADSLGTSFELIINGTKLV